MTSRKLTIALFAALVAAGCSTSKAIELPNGGTGYMLKCHHPGDCEARAVKVCPHGHQVVEGMGKPGKTQVVECSRGDG